MATNSGGAGPTRPRDRLSREQEAKLSEVLKEVHPRLLTVVMRMTRDYHLAHDVTQEACLAVIQEFRRGTVFRKPVIVFATVVARNKFLSELGRMRAQLERPSDELPEGGRPWPDTTAPHDITAGLEYLELLAAVKAAIRDERQATVWELTHVWGLKGIEIAALLKVSSATVSRDLEKAETKAKRISEPHAEQ